jgi:hypothetical protein
MHSPRSLDARLAWCGAGSPHRVPNEGGGLGSQLKSVSDEAKSQVKLRTNLDDLSLLSLDQDIQTFDLFGVAALPRWKGLEGSIQTGSKNGLALGTSLDDLSLLSLDQDIISLVIAALPRWRGSRQTGSKNGLALAIIWRTSLCDHTKTWRTHRIPRWFVTYS